MRITALEVDGFGVWSGLKLDKMVGGLNVFRTERAGKTTLMQFIRTVLYGFRRPGGGTCLRNTAAGRAARWPCRRRTGSSLSAVSTTRPIRRRSSSAWSATTAAGTASNCWSRCCRRR